MNTQPHKPDFVEISRALLVLLAGAALLWCLWWIPLDFRRHWVAWVAVQSTALLGFPILLRAIFLEEPLSAYGFALGHRRQSLLWGAGLFVAILPLLVYAARLPEFQVYYPRMLAARHDPRAFGLYLATMLVYLFAWEAFFRGFLLFALARGLTAPVGIVLQAVPFGLMHWGKPPAEVYGSFAAGVLLGWVSWRCRSFVPAFLAHASANVVFNVLVVRAGAGGL